MQSEEVGRSSLRPDLVAVALLALAAVSLAGTLFEAAPPHSTLPLHVALGAMLAGGLAAALVLRGAEEDDRRAAVCGSWSAAFFALASAVAWLVLRPALLGAVTPQSALAIAGGICAVAGYAVGCVLHSNAARCGHTAGAWMLGVGAGEVLVRLLLRGNMMEAGVVVGGAAAGGALLIAAPKKMTGAIGAAVAALVISGLAVALPAMGWGLPWMAAADPWWRLSAAAAAEVRRVVMWSSGMLAVAAPAALLPRFGREQRSGLARLHSIVLLWGAGAVLAGLRPAGAIAAAGSAPLLHLAVGLVALGGAIGAIVGDTWSLVRASLTRAFVAGAVGVALALATGGVVGVGGRALPGGHWAGDALIVAVPLLLSLVVGVSARIGVLVGPAHAIWLWACAGLSALAAAGYVGGLPTQVDGLLARAAVLLGACSFVAASEVRLWRDSAARALGWLRGEWSPKPVREVAAEAERGVRDYPAWLGLLRFLTYVGYLPWWIVSMIGRGILAGLSALVATTVGIVAGAAASVLQLALGKDQRAYGETAGVERDTPVVQLSALREQGEQTEEEATRPRGLEIGEIVALPMLALAFGADRILRGTAALLQRLSGMVPGHRRPAAEMPPVGDTETLVLGSRAHLALEAALTPEAVRDAALRRRTVDFWWWRWLRGAVSLVGSAKLRDSLAPDTPEPWDDRVFRTAVVGPRGRQFELFGHLWASRRRRGCVVTIPILSGNEEKAVEVDARHREVRTLLREDAEEVKKLLLRAAYRMAVRDVVAGLHATRTVVCDSPRQDLIEPHQDRYCELREEVPGGRFRCRVPMEQDRRRGATTLSACAQCDFPEIWQRCDHLNLEGTVGVVGDDGVLRRRAQMVCRLERKRPEVENCPQRECFSPSVITRVTEVETGRTR